MKTIYILIITILFLISCKNNESYETYMSDIRQIYPQIKEGEWYIYNRQEFDDEKLYQQQLIQNDTAYNLNLSVFSKEMMKEFNFENKYNVELYKEYSDSVYKYELKMNNSDTVHYFRTPINKENERFYFIGKYRYLFEEKQLNPCQVDYYLKHTDSLNKVKGNNVPDLPCLEDSIK